VIRINLTAAEMPTMRHVGSELPTSDKAELPRTGFSACSLAAIGWTGTPPREAKQGAHPWYMVLWLTGVDYFFRPLIFLMSD